MIGKEILGRVTLLLCFLNVTTNLASGNQNDTSLNENEVWDQYFTQSQGKEKNEGAKRQDEAQENGLSSEDAVDEKIDLSNSTLEEVKLSQHKNYKKVMATINDYFSRKITRRMDVNEFHRLRTYFGNGQGCFDDYQEAKNRKLKEVLHYKQYVGTKGTYSYVKKNNQSYSRNLCALSDKASTSGTGVRVLKTFYGAGQYAVAGTGLLLASVMDTLVLPFKMNSNSNKKDKLISHFLISQLLLELSHPLDQINQPGTVFHRLINSETVKEISGERDVDAQGMYNNLKKLNDNKLLCPKKGVKYTWDELKVVIGLSKVEDIDFFVRNISVGRIDKMTAYESLKMYKKN